MGFGVERRGSREIVGAVAGGEFCGLGEQIWVGGFETSFTGGLRSGGLASPEPVFGLRLR